MRFGIEIRIRVLTLKPIPQFKIELILLRRCQRITRIFIIIELVKIEESTKRMKQMKPFEFE